MSSAHQPPQIFVPNGKKTSNHNMLSSRHEIPKKHRGVAILGHIVGVTCGHFGVFLISMFFAESTSSWVNNHLEEAKDFALFFWITVGLSFGLMLLLEIGYIILLPALLNGLFGVLLAIIRAAQGKGYEYPNMLRWYF